MSNVKSSAPCLSAVDTVWRGDESRCETFSFLVIVGSLDIESSSYRMFSISGFKFQMKNKSAVSRPYINVYFYFLLKPQLNILL